MFPSKPNVIAVIPARKNSKGLPGKNKKEFLGKPLTEWTIDQALRSDLITSVVLSTDDQDLWYLATEKEITLHKRPKELATDKAPIIDVIKEVLSPMELGASDVVVLLEPTSPLRPKGFIDDCLAKFLATEWAKSAVSIAEHKSTHPDFSFALSTEGKIWSDEATPLVYKLRQDVTPFYYLEGSFYCTSVGRIIEEGLLYGTDTLGICVESWQAVEIDDSLDWILAETIGKQYSEFL